MPNLDYTELRADIIQYIKDNFSEEITGQIEQDRLLNIVDSTINLKTGGLIVRARLGQFIYIEPLDDKEYAPKKYVDDNSGSKEVTDAPTKALLTNDANWTGNIYTGTPITTYPAGSFYITPTHDYKFFTLSGTVTVRRIPYAYL